MNKLAVNPRATAWAQPLNAATLLALRGRDPSTPAHAAGLDGASAYDASPLADVDGPTAPVDGSTGSSDVGRDSKATAHSSL